MKNKGSGHLTENELDGLLNEVFLNLDFEANAVNKKVLSAVGKQTMTPKSIFDFLTSYRLNIVFLIFSLIVCLSSFYRYVIAFDISEKTSIPLTVHSNSVELTQTVDISKLKDMGTSKRVASSGRIEKEGNRAESTTNTKTKNTVLIQKEENKADSTLITTKTQISSRVADSLSQKARQDSLQGVEHIQSSAVSAAAENAPAKSQKNVRNPLPEVKAKVGKRSNSRKFRKEGTFRMKGGRYGKSKHPYHR